VDIRLLQANEYPPPPELVDRLRRIIREKGLTERIEVVNVKNPQETRRLGFLGSPSIHVNGYDIELSRRGDPPHYGYRNYMTEHREDLSPPSDLFRAALKRALAPKVNVLFLCTGNSCRSQMAEGWTRWFWGDLIDVLSAGIEVHGLKPKAVQVMAEEGVDISRHRSKHLSKLVDIKLEFVIAVCDNAQESCPVFPGEAKILHQGFDDPPKLARGAKTAEEILLHYRRVRDEIKDYTQMLAEVLGLLDRWGQTMV